MNDVVTEQHAGMAGSVRWALAHLHSTADLRSIGMESRDPSAARIQAAEPAILGFLQQGPVPTPSSQTLSELRKLAETLQIR